MCLFDRYLTFADNYNLTSREVQRRIKELETLNNKRNMFAYLGVDLIDKDWQHIADSRPRAQTALKKTRSQFVVKRRGSKTVAKEIIDVGLLAMNQELRIRNRRAIHKDNRINRWPWDYAYKQ